MSSSPLLSPSDSENNNNNNLNVSSSSSPTSSSQQKTKPKISKKVVEQLYLKEVIEIQKKKCKEDANYFIKKYVKIQTQDLGIIPFSMFDFQEKLITDINNNDRVIILKSRQMGISTLIAAYTLWMMLFNEGKNILIISIKETTAKEIIKKIKLANENLPSFLKIVSVEDSMTSITLKNNSMVKATSSASDSARSFSASIVIFDEASFIPEMEDLWDSAQPTLSTTKNGKAILLSTPNGVGGFFHRTWVDAENKENSFHPIKLMWDLRPDRDEKWKMDQIKDMGIRKFGQEYGCDFISSGANVIDLFILKEYEEHKIRLQPNKGIKDPIEMRYGQSLWIFDLADRNKDYIMGVDTARGDGSDYSAAHVLELETLVQVAEFHAKIDPANYGDYLSAIGQEYNDALIAVERTGGLGYMVLQRLIDRQYKNIFCSSTDFKVIDIYKQYSNRYNREESKLLPGFETTTTTRPLIISKLEAYFRERAVDIRSVRTINELKTFIWNKGKAQAAEGYNDDLSLSLGMALWIRDTALRLRKEGILLTKSILGGMNVVKNENSNNTPIYTSKIQSVGKSQWQMGTGKQGNMESLTWLLR